MVKKQTGIQFNAICVTHRWVACGTYNGGASVWDMELQKKVIDVEGNNYVGAVDLSPDSTSLATGTGGGGNYDNAASIWSLASGKRLVGPLKHGNSVSGIKFSPNGEHVATACSGRPICVFDSRNGDKLITIKTTIPGWIPATPLAWSGDSQKLFATSHENKIKSFDVSTGSQLTESPIIDGDIVFSIALAANGKFFATFAQPHSISFLDAQTLTRIGPVIEDSKYVRSIAISPDNCYLAVGREDGKVIIRDLSKILPDLYGPFHVSTCAFVVPACWTSPILSLALTNYFRHLLTRKDKKKNSL